MKKHFFRIFVALILGLGAWSAMADLTDAPAPTQSFQQASSGKPIVHKAVKLAVVAPPPAPVENPASIALQAQLTQLNQNNLLYQQKTDQQIEDLNNKNQLMQQQLQQLAQALTLLNQEMVQLKQVNDTLHQTIQAQQAAHNTSTGWLGILQNKTVLVSAAVIVLLLLIWAVWPRGKKVVKTAAEDDTKVEYDYMGSNESIPAKLNLARTYVAMEDFAAARKVLDEVAQLGTSEQQAQAEEMRKVLPAGV